MARISAGLLMYRRRGGALEVLLVHSGGPFWARKDAGAWSIPKGEIDPSEEPLAAARREFAEETGFAADGAFLPLASITQAGGKVVQAWAFEGDADPAALQSNSFSIEWPPRSGQQKSFPEVDRAAWFPLDLARQKINPAQVALLDELASLV
ncbi:MAG: NUDIX domain-containing protein [Geminicoccaceae bacterium]